MGDSTFSPPPLPALGATSTDAIRTLRFPLNQKMVSQKAPAAIMSSLRAVLATQGVHVRVGDTAFCLWCETGPLAFEAEIVKIPRLNLHGVHFKRVRGESEEYRRLCSAIIDAMDL
jgi:hypothetical protein